MAARRTGRPLGLAVALALSLGAVPATAAEPSESSADPSYCDVLGLDELNALSSVRFDSAQARGPSCIFTQAEGNQSVFVIGAPAVEVMKSMEPGGEDLTVDERQAYLRNGQLFVELSQGSVMVEVSLDDGSPPDSEQAFVLATRIIDVMVPRLEEQQRAAAAILEASREPSLCDVITVDELNALGPIRYGAAPADAEPEACSYVKAEPEGGFLTLDFRVHEGQVLSIDSMKSFYPTGREVVIAGHAAWAVDADPESFEPARLMIARDAGLFEVTLDYFEEGATGGVDAVDHAVAVAEVIVPRLTIGHPEQGGLWDESGSD